MKIKYSTTFRLEKRRDKKSGDLIVKNVPIRMDFVYQGKRLTYYVGYRVDLADWDSVNEFVKLTEPNKLIKSVINTHISLLRSSIEEVYINARLAKIDVDNQYLLNKLKDRLDEQ